MSVKNVGYDLRLLFQRFEPSNYKRLIVTGKMAAGEIQGFLQSQPCIGLTLSVISSPFFFRRVEFVAIRQQILLYGLLTLSIEHAKLYKSRSQMLIGV